MAVTAAMVKELRDKTGAGMMDCKKALTECGADVEKAIDWLRQKGLSKAAKRADRVTSEGVIASSCSADKKTATIVEVMTETDFVARGEKFQSFAQSVADEINAQDPSDLDGFADRINELVAVTGEKTVLGRHVRISIEGDGVMGVYVHNNKRAVLVEVHTSAPANDVVADFASTIARQIMATDPLALDEAGVDPAVLDRERNVYRQKAIEEGKPEKIIDKIVEGAVKKFCKEVCLLEQPYFFDEKMSVTDYRKATEKAAGMSIEIKRFISMKLGV